MAHKFNEHTKWKNGTRHLIKFCETFFCFLLRLILNAKLSVTNIGGQKWADAKKNFGVYFDQHLGAAPEGPSKL